MPEPLRKTMTNQRTGEARDFISNDGGKSWQMDATSAGDVALDHRIAAAGPEDTSAISPITPPSAEPEPEQPGEAQPNIHETVLPVQQIEGDTGSGGGWNAYAQAMSSPTTGVDDVGGSLRALATGASMGQNRRTAATGAELASAFGPSDPVGYERQYPAGSESGDIETSEKSANDQAVAEHPGWHALGATAPIMATAELGGAGGLGTLGRMAVNAGVAGGVSGLQNVGESDAATPQDAWDRFSEGAKAPAVIAGGLTGLGGMVGAGAEWAGKYMPEFSRYMRGVAARVGDLPETQRDELIKTVGDKPEQAIGGAIERLGLTGKSKMPMSGTGYARAAGEMATDLGDEYGAILDRNSQAGVEMPKADLVQQLRGLQSKYRGTAGDNARAMTRKVNRALSDLETGPGYANKQSLTVRDLQDLKKVYETEGGFKPGEAPATQPIAASKAASRDIATKARSGLSETMDQMAFREDLPRFHGLKNDIGTLNTIRGVALGTEGRTDLAGSVARAAHSPTMALIHLGKDYGADVAATGLKGAGVGLRAMGALDTAAADPAYRASSSLLMLGRQRERPLPSQPQPMPSAPAMPQPVPAAPQNVPARDPSQAQQQSKGHEQIGVMKQRMQQAPTTFGKYAPELQAALDSEKPDEEFATTVTRLSSTDPFFRTHYMHGGSQ